MRRLSKLLVLEVLSCAALLLSLLALNAAGLPAFVIVASAAAGAIIVGITIGCATLPGKLKAIWGKNVG